MIEHYHTAYIEVGKREIVSRVGGSGDFVDWFTSVCIEVRDGLYDDGSLWFRIPDCYLDGQKQMLPYRVAVKLQEMGWTIRNDVIVVDDDPVEKEDRFSDAKTVVFHATPKPDYWYDLHPVLVETDEGVMKNPGDVIFGEWEELVDRIVQASCPPKICERCERPYERVKERVRSSKEDDEARVENAQSYSSETMSKHEPHTGRFPRSEYEVKGWESCCECETDEEESGKVAVFGDAMSIVDAAKDHGRRVSQFDDLDNLSS